MPQGIQDTVAGRTQLVILAYAAARPFVADGRLRPLAITSPGREKGLDAVPAVAETFPGFDFQGWFGVVAPTGTPSDIVSRLSRAIDAALGDAEVVRKMGDLGVHTETGGTPESFGKFIQAEFGTWQRVVHEIGLEPE
jgi:tripartite-type tricarboxylate transporter receptor subunit TctC